MEHFSIQNWVDFVRGVVPEAQRSMMQKHLDEECSKCGEVVETWKHVLDCAIRENSYEPPEACLRIAKTQFASSRTPGEQLRAVLFAQLMFDSLAQPVAAGIRSAGTATTRQLVFRKGSYSIDIHIESNGDKQSITGQLLDANQSNRAMHDVSVRVLAYKEQTITNRFGEFQFDVDSVEELGLLFVLKERDLMVSIPVSRVRPLQDTGSPVLDKAEAEAEAEKA